MYVYIKYLYIHIYECIHVCRNTCEYMIYTTENMYGQRPFDLAQVCSSACAHVYQYLYIYIYMDFFDVYTNIYIYMHMYLCVYTYRNMCEYVKITTQNMYGQRPFDLTHVQILAHVAHTNILIVLQGVFLQ